MNPQRPPLNVGAPPPPQPQADPPPPSGTSARFAFMDATEAAAMLRTDRPTVLEYIRAGRLKTFGGKPGNPFLRTEQVEQLAAEFHAARTDADAEEADAEAAADLPPLDPRTVHRNDPVRNVNLRISGDTKWASVDERAIRLWAAELPPFRRDKMREVARDTIQRLNLLMAVLDEADEDAHQSAASSLLDTNTKTHRED